MFEKLADVPWETWSPTMRATLVLVLEEGRLLLIRKKRGLGAGKINGPGGRIDPGESPRACAARELEEELCVRAVGLELRGELSFQFVDGLALHVHVFSAPGRIGEPTETSEAIPLWVTPDTVPYDEMWADDRLWMPHLFAGHTFCGRFLFDGDRMLGAELQLDATLSDPDRVLDAPQRED